MDISGINLEELSRYANTQDTASKRVQNSDSINDFQSIFDSAKSLINETNDLSNAAEEEEIKFATGESDNLHTLQVAQQKANVSLQYTVAVRNAVIDAYKTIINMQF